MRYALVSILLAASSLVCATPAPAFADPAAFLVMSYPSAASFPNADRLPDKTVALAADTGVFYISSRAGASWTQMASAVAQSLQSAGGDANGHIPIHVNGGGAGEVDLTLDTSTALQSLTLKGQNRATGPGGALSIASGNSGDGPAGTMTVDTGSPGGGTTTTLRLGPGGAQIVDIGNSGSVTNVRGTAAFDAAPLLPALGAGTVATTDTTPTSLYGVPGSVFADGHTYAVHSTGIARDTTDSESGVWDYVAVLGHTGGFCVVVYEAFTITGLLHLSGGTISSTADLSGGLVVRVTGLASTNITWWGFTAAGALVQMT